MKQPRKRSGSTQSVFEKFSNRSGRGDAGYVEIAGDMLTVHSERATPLRWHAMLLNRVEMGSLYQMEITTLVYTNDADQKFVYDLTKNVEVK